MANAVHMVNEWNSSKTIFRCLLAAQVIVVLATVADKLPIM